MKSTSEFVVPRERTLAEKVCEVVLDELGRRCQWIALILAESGVVASDSEQSWFALTELLLQWKSFGDEQEWREAPLLAEILSTLRDLTGSNHLSCEGIELAHNRVRKYVT